MTVFFDHQEKGLGVLIIIFSSITYSVKGKSLQ